MLSFGPVQIEGNNTKADDAIMLDKDGYVSETNATNLVCHHPCLKPMQLTLYVIILGTTVRRAFVLHLLIIC